MTVQNHIRTVKSYVVRGGRLTHSQQKALDELWPVFGLDREQGFINKEKIFSNAKSLVFEIGFGMGDSLVQMAKDNPAVNFIGVDVHPPGVGTLLRNVKEEGLNNVRVYQDDANLVLQECIPDDSLDAVQIFFPDPWHKKRHQKRRLIQTDFVEKLLPKMKQNGLLHLATDWENYAEQMMDVLTGINGLENQFGAGNFALQERRPVTKFQRRGEKLGHGVWDLMFIKK